MTGNLFCYISTSFFIPNHDSNIKVQNENGISYFSNAFIGKTIFISIGKFSFMRQRFLFNIISTNQTVRGWKELFIRWRLFSFGIGKQFFFFRVRIDGPKLINESIGN
jgi:hypothetical protein